MKTEVCEGGDTAVVHTQYTVIVLLFGFRQKKRKIVFLLSFHRQLHPYVTEET